MEKGSQTILQGWLHAPLPKCPKGALWENIVSQQRVYPKQKTLDLLRQALKDWSSSPIH